MVNFINLENQIVIMNTINLEEKVLEVHGGRNTYRAPRLLSRWLNQEGYIPSEADMRLMGIRNYEANPQIIKSYWDTSTLVATRGDAVKVILPYDNSGSHTLTEAAAFGLSLISKDEQLVDRGIDLNKESRWDRLEGEGVYTLQRSELTVNRHLTKEEAMENPLLLTKLGHPNYVSPNFARSEYEAITIIEDVFSIAAQVHKSKYMMGQFIHDKSEKGILEPLAVQTLGGGAASVASKGVDNGSRGRLAFVYVPHAAISSQ